MPKRAMGAPYLRVVLLGMLGTAGPDPPAHAGPSGLSHGARKPRAPGCQGTNCTPGWSGPLPSPLRRRRRVWGKRTTLRGRKSRGASSGSDACSEKTEDGEREARDDTSCHSLSCLLWIRSVMSSPGGSFKRYCTASSRVRFWKLVSFACRGKTLRHDPPVGQRDGVPAGSWGLQGGRGSLPPKCLPQAPGDPGDSPSGWHLHPAGCQHSAGDRTGYLQDLVPFLDALAVGRAPLLYTRHEDAHVVPASQPQPHALGLHELHDPGVGAVPATGEAAVSPAVRQGHAGGH